MYLTDFCSGFSNKQLLPVTGEGIVSRLLTYRRCSLLTTTRPATLLAARLMAMVLITFTASYADVIQSTVILPPATGAYSLGGACLSVLSRCTQNAVVSDFDILSRTVVNGNEVVEVNANYRADIFTDNGGVPGAFIGHLLLPGTVTFTYLGRDPAVNPLGTFITELTDFGFQGTLNANTFEVRRDPSKNSVGSTTILPASVLPTITYEVSGSVEIFALYSFNGSPFMPAPPRTAGLTPIPEPGSGLLAGSILAGMIVIRSRRRRTGAAITSLQRRDSAGRR